MLKDFLKLRHKYVFLADVSVNFLLCTKTHFIMITLLYILTQTLSCVSQTFAGLL
jgi:hypothetical protein